MSVRNGLRNSSSCLCVPGGEEEALRGSCPADVFLEVIVMCRCGDRPLC